MASLSTYPKWKLLELGEFHGYFSETLRFLDGIQSPIRDAYKELGYDRDRKQLEYNPSRTIARDCREFVESLPNLAESFRPSKNRQEDPVQWEKERQSWLLNKRTIEKAGLENLHGKYPHAGFDRVLQEVRFNGI